MFSSSAKLLARRAVGVGKSGGVQGQILSANPSKWLSTAAATKPAGRHVEEVTFLRLNNLQDNPGAVKKGRRVGRGIGSSKGKTCGKGHKGQRARNRSSIPAGFEGGQTKFWKLLPKKGFSNKRHRQKQGAELATLNLGAIQDFIDMGRFESLNNNNNNADAATLGIVEFINAGMLKKTPSLPGVKLLAKGKERFTSPVRLIVNRASEEAIAHTEKVGGQVTTMHYNRLAMRALIRPDKFTKFTPIKEEDAESDGSDDVEESYLLPKQARPPPKMQPYYTSWKNRGYLCPQIQMRAWLEKRPDLEEVFEKTLKLEESKKEALSEEG